MLCKYMLDVQVRIVACCQMQRQVSTALSISRATAGELHTSCGGGRLELLYLQVFLNVEQQRLHNVFIRVEPRSEMQRDVLQGFVVWESVVREACAQPLGSKQLPL